MVEKHTTGKLHDDVCWYFTCNQNGELKKPIRCLDSICKTWGSRFGMVHLVVNDRKNLPGFGDGQTSISVVIIPICLLHVYMLEIIQLMSLQENRKTTTSFMTYILVVEDNNDY